MYGDTQTWGISHGWTSSDSPGYPSILGVNGYSDTGANHGWTSSDSPGYPEYPRCTWILRHGGSIMGGRPRIVRDTLSILGVHEYSDTESSHGWTSSDSLGHSWHPRCTGILRHGGSIMCGHPRIVRDTLGILGVCRYSDTGHQSWVDIPK